MERQEGDPRVVDGLVARFDGDCCLDPIRRADDTLFILTKLV